MILSKKFSARARPVSAPNGPASIFAVFRDYNYVITMMMPSKHDLSDETQINREHRLKVLNLNNKILQAKHDYLTNLKKHYESYWLNLDLECYEARMACLINKAKFLTYQAISETINKSKEDIKLMDSEIAQASKRLQMFKSLNPQLLAMYRSLKDEIECQEMLIKISECNISQDAS